MGWQFAALWAGDPDATWKWVWRRVADDDGATLAQSGEFERLDDCIEDARRNGFEESCGPVD